MNSLLSGALFILLAITALRDVGAQTTPPAADALAEDHDVRFYQSALDGQQRRLDALDAILSATGLLVFTAMTYLLAIDTVRDGPLAPRLLAVALLLPVALTVYAVVGYAGVDAPDLVEFDAAVRENRAASYEEARRAMVQAFVANRHALVAKQLLRNWATALASVLFLADLLVFVVQW
jgi:hypothetical protein